MSEQELPQEQTPQESAPEAKAVAAEAPAEAPQGETAGPAAAPAAEPPPVEPAKPPAPKPTPQGGGREPRERGPKPDRGPKPEQRGPRDERKPAERAEPRGERPDRGDRGRDRDRDRGPRGDRPIFGGPMDIEIEKLIADSLYLDNQAHAVVARMRDLDSGTRSQLRRFYSAVRRATRAPESERQHQFVMLRARLAYTIARHQLRSLDTLERLLLQVTRKNDARGYERFRDLFEAIVAYNE